MKKKTILITIAAVGFVLLGTLSLLVYGAYHGAAFLLTQASTQQVQMQNWPDQISTHWGYLQSTIKTPECQSAIAQVTNLQVWLTGAEEGLIPQIGIACLGSYFKSQDKSAPETEDNQSDLI